MNQEWLQQIVSQVFQRCPRCQHPFEQKDIRIVGQIDETWILSLHCRHCHALAIIGLALTPSGELSLEAASHPTQTAPVSADDLLDMHLFLESFNGDFRSLFVDSDPSAASEKSPQ